MTRTSILHKTQARTATVFSGVLLVTLALGGCNQKPIVAPALVLEPSATLSHQVGSFDAASKAMVAAPGEKGFVTFGPYAELPPGQYQVTFDVSIDGASDGAGQADVNAYTPSQSVGVLTTTDLKNGARQKISLDFAATAGPKYEFRVSSNGTGTIRLFGIVVKRHQ